MPQGVGWIPSQIDSKFTVTCLSRDMDRDTERKEYFRGQPEHAAVTQGRLEPLGTVYILGRTWDQERLNSSVEQLLRSLACPARGSSWGE